MSTTTGTEPHAEPLAASSFANPYGHFDETRREYVVTDPDTPRPWINYLFNDRLAAMVSQGAGGCCWLERADVARISRYRFLSLPEDRPGFYVYLRHADGSFWSPSFHPCRTPLEAWRCRHGVGYSAFEGVHQQVEARLKLFIAPREDVLVWDLHLCNHGPSAQPLFLANYLEFSLLEYARELHAWSVLRNQTRFVYQPALHGIRYDYRVFEAQQAPAVLLTSWPDPAGYDCDRDAFIGRGRSEADPRVIMEGRSADSQLPGGGRGIGSLSHHLVLEPGQTRRVLWVLATGSGHAEAAALARSYRNPQRVDRAWTDLKRQWQRQLAILQVDVPDDDMRRSLNVWNPYAAIVNARRNRDISSEITGFDFAIRYRDSSQYSLPIATLEPEQARRNLERVLRHQRHDGTGIDRFVPGRPAAPDHHGARCDNNVWPVLTACQYVAETGDLDFLRRQLPYEDDGEGSVYEHLLRGMGQIVRDVGQHGLPLLKGRDWDDHLQLFAEPGAESVMTAQNWCYAALRLAEVARHLARDADAAWLDEHRQRFADALNRSAWDGDWYRQLLFADGKTPLGSAAREENRVYLNTQSWAVLSRTAPRERALRCMDAAAEHLDTPIGLKLLAPPYTGIPTPRDPLTSNGPGVGENGGVFIHANTWAIIAEAMLGRGDRAYKYYRQVLPSVLSERVGADTYLNEPYVYSSHVVAEPGPRPGMGNIGWLSGCVGWMYVAATQHILGVQPTLAGLRLRPCLPSHWRRCRLTRRYRGALYRILIEQVGDGPTIEVDGRRIEGDTVPPVSEREVEVCVRL